VEIVKNFDDVKDRVLDFLHAGNPIIIPTDTNYNLACLPTNNAAIDKIFAYKKRKKDKPLSLFFLTPEDWARYGVSSNNTVMDILVKNFWPGPLNIVLNRINNEFDYMLNGYNSISLGCIANKTWRNILKSMSGGPIAITSANISGMVDEGLVTKEIAIEHMGNKVKYMVQSENDIASSKSSTIVRVKEDGVLILREGDIGTKELESVLCSKGFNVYA